MFSWIKDLLWVLTSEKVFNQSYNFDSAYIPTDTEGKPGVGQGNIKIFRSWYFGKKSLKKDMEFFKNIRANLCEKIDLDLNPVTVIEYDFSVYVGPYRVNIQCKDYVSSIHKPIKCLFDYAENILVSRKDFLL